MTSLLIAQLRRELAEASADNARLRARIAGLAGKATEPAPRRQVVRREPWVLAVLREGPATVPEIIARALFGHVRRVSPSRGSVQVALSKYRDRIERSSRPGSRLTVYRLRA